jgi:predicted RNA polymerase sigma factor
MINRIAVSHSRRPANDTLCVRRQRKFDPEFDDGEKEEEEEEEEKVTREDDGRRCCCDHLRVFLLTCSFFLFGWVRVARTLSLSRCSVAPCVLDLQECCVSISFFVSFSLTFGFTR